jgi:hypothetical protein
MIENASLKITRCIRAGAVTEFMTVGAQKCVVVFRGKVKKNFAP